jgi:hypothetical protein
VVRALALLGFVVALGAAFPAFDQTILPASVAQANTAIEAMAGQSRRGLFPRGFSGEQPYWTLLAADGGEQSGLISEDGAIELAKGGPSVEPFVVDHGRLVTWADVAVGQSLEDGHLPIPSVTWRGRGWRLRVTAFVAGGPARPGLVARYDLFNLTGRTQVLTLALAVRPIQVDGPAQFLNAPGGLSPIARLAWKDGLVWVDGRPRLRPLGAPDRFIATPFEGAAFEHALVSASGETDSARDGRGLASGALTWRVTLPAYGSRTVAWVAPLGEAAAPPGPVGGNAEAWLDRRQQAVAAAWRERLGSVSFTVPPAGRPMIDTLKTSLAVMLGSRNRAMLRPGTRSYDRSWIRDGAMISEALLRLGAVDVAADYLRWYAPYQFADGNIPCCVDGRGADPTPENDSQGEFIFLAAEVWRYGGDKALLRAVWPRVLAAANYMDRLRLSERTGANRAPDRRMLYGLMPPSISHEGYSSKPAFSYWDDFWALRGFKDAVFLAQALGEEGARARLALARDAFQADLLASIPASAAAHGVDFIPGAADLGDFDATSTTIALAPGGEGEALPPRPLEATFERYWREFVQRRDGDRSWDAYTPYELRVVGAFVRLGRRDRAAALLEYFLKDRRPAAWNGWAEVVGRDARKPRFIGDMPHAWVASDYARSVLDMFAYERASDGALVLGAGLPGDWFDGPGVGVAGLRTPYGPLTWSARRRGAALVLRVAGPRPPGGYVFAWPLAGPPGAARFDGRPMVWTAGAVHFDGPGQVVIDWPAPRPRALTGPGLATPPASRDIQGWFAKRAVLPRANLEGMPQAP